MLSIPLKVEKQQSKAKTYVGHSQPKGSSWNRKLSFLQNVSFKRKHLNPKLNKLSVVLSKTLGGLVRTNASSVIIVSILFQIIQTEEPSILLSKQVKMKEKLMCCPI